MLLWMAHHPWGPKGRKNYLGYIHVRSVCLLWRKVWGEWWQGENRMASRTKDGEGTMLHRRRIWWNQLRLARLWTSQRMHRGDERDVLQQSSHSKILKFSKKETNNWNSPAFAGQTAFTGELLHEVLEERDDPLINPGWMQSPKPRPPLPLSPSLGTTPP